MDNIRPDIRPDVWPDIWPDIRPDIQPDIRPDIWPDIRCWRRLRLCGHAAGAYFYALRATRARSATKGALGLYLYKFLHLHTCHHCVTHLICFVMLYGSIQSVNT